VTSVSVDANTQALHTSITNTVTVSGTVTANIGTTNGLALDATLAKLTLAQGSTTASQTGPLVQAAVTTAAPAYTTGQTSPLSLTTTGLLRVDGSGVTQPVSGTVTANQGGAPWSQNITQIGGSSLTLGQKTMANSVPVVIASDQGAVSISGTVTANIGTTNGLALDATLAKLTLGQGSSTATQTGPLVQGAVTTAAPTYTTGQTSPLSLTTGGLLRIDGSGVTQPVSGTITANAGTGNFSVLGTKTNNNAAPGATNIGALCGIANSAAPSWTEGNLVGLSVDLAGNLRVTGSFTSSGAGDTIGSNGTLNALNVVASVALAGQGSVGMQLDSGTLAATLTPELSYDGGTTWVATKFVDLANTQTSTLVLTNPNSATALSILTLGGASNARVRVSSFTSGSAVARLRATFQAGPVFSGSGGGSNASVGATGSAIPTSATLIGASDGTNLQQLLVESATNRNLRVSIYNGANELAVNGSGQLAVSNFPATQAVNLSQVGGAAVALGQAAMASSIPVVIASNQSAVSISGTVTANIGTTNGLALDATLAKLNVTQGTALGANTGPLMQGSVTTAAPAYTTGNINPLSLTTTGLLRVDGSGVTQPVSGTITANIGTTNGLALDATLAKLTIAQGTALGSNTQALMGASVTTAAPAYTTGQISPLSLTTTGLLRVDGSGVTQPVSGTVTANQGGAPWSQNITQVGGASISLGQKTSANSFPVVISSDQSAVASNITFVGGSAFSLGTHISASSFPVVIASDQAALAVTQSGTWTVQQGTPPWSVVGNVASAAADSGNPVKIGGVFNTTQPTVTTGQRVDLQTTSHGGLIVASGTDRFDINIATINGTTASVLPAGQLRVTAEGVNASNSVPGGNPVYVGGINSNGVTAPLKLFDIDTGAGVDSVVGANLRISASGGSIEAKGQQVAASSIPVVIASDQSAVTIANQPDFSGSGSLTNSGDTVVLGIGAGTANWVAQITGTWAGTINFEASPDGVNWVSINGRQTGIVNNSLFNATTSNGVFRGTPGGFLQFRVRASSWITGTASVLIRTTTGSGAVFFNDTLSTQLLALDQNNNYSPISAQSLDGEVNLYVQDVQNRRLLEQILLALTTSAYSAGTAGGAYSGGVGGVVGNMTPGGGGGAARTDGWGNAKVTEQTTTSGGAFVSRLIAAGTTNATVAKIGSGQVYGWYLFNAAAATRYFKIYDKGGPPTVGSDMPLMTIGIPAGAAANVWFGSGIQFMWGISYATTVNPADTDATAVTANDLIINLFYA
jgi:hypothetical protein